MADRNCLTPLTLAAVLMLLVMIGNAWAQEQPLAIPPCQSHADMVVMLESRYSEQPWAMALQNNGRMVEVYRTANGETWTILMTRPEGWSCIVAAGVSWQDRHPPAHQMQQPAACAHRDLATQLEALCGE